MFQQIVDSVPFEVTTPTPEEVRSAASYTAVKDAPIVAAAKRAEVDYLVSLDRRHLVGQPHIAQCSGLKIVLPDELLGELCQPAGDD